MKKRVIFVTHNNLDPSDGVWKKINSQVKSLRNLDFNVDFFYMDKKNIIVDNGEEIKKISLGSRNKYLFYKIIKEYIQGNKKEAYHLAYIRKPHGGAFVIYLSGLISFLKRFNSDVIMEIPTYPYKNEINTLSGKISDVIFDMSLPFFRKKIDKIVFLGQADNDIWGIKSIQISNGIDIYDARLLEEKNNITNDFIFVGVANLAFWHGYDRIITGIKNYKGSKNVIFKIAGNSEPEYSRLKNLVASLELESNVIFEGKVSGRILESILQSADVCVDALGRHRSGNNINNSIKSKEYSARGLPFIKSHYDNSFSGQEEFILQFNADDSPIDISKVIFWRENLNSGFSLRERDFAMKNLTWEKQFEFLLGDK